jgi:hypothetical protein
MEAFSDIFAFVAGLPAIVGLIITALIIFLTSDWRLTQTALLVQYVLAGIALTRFIRVEVAIVKILIGVLAVFILYLTARRIQEGGTLLLPSQGRSRILGLAVRWRAGPLGLPLRLLAILLVALGLVLVFNTYQPVLVSPDMTLVAFWLGAIGMLGLVLSSDPMRVAPGVLTILTGFELIYASLEPSLAMAGFLGAMVLLSALAFSYLATVQNLNSSSTELKEDEGQS